jgi:hypothetical protein
MGYSGFGRLPNSPRPQDMPATRPFIRANNLPRPPTQTTMTAERAITFNRKALKPKPYPCSRNWGAHAPPRAANRRPRRLVLRFQLDGTVERIWMVGCGWRGFNHRTRRRVRSLCNCTVPVIREDSRQQSRRRRRQSRAVSHVGLAETGCSAHSVNSIQ